MVFPLGFAGFDAAVKAAIDDVLTVDAVEVQGVIDTTISRSEDLNTEAFNTVKERVRPSVFGGYEGAQVVVNAHANAHTITHDTIIEVKAALADFAKQLGESLKDLGNAEDQSKAMLDRLAGITPGDAGNSTHEATEQQTGFDINGTPTDETTDEGSS